MSNIFYGIDFGTTNCALYAIRKEDNAIIGTVNIGENEKHPLPSFVAINRINGEVFTGLEAKNLIDNNRDYYIVSSVKSVINNDDIIEINGKEWTNKDVIAELFKSLNKKAIEKIGEEIKEAVISIPVDFDPRSKPRLREILKSIPIEIKEFISEPTAAFFSHKNELKHYSNVIIFDWGGGTLDVVSINVDKNVVTEISKKSMKQAGDDIDKKIAEKIVTNFSDKNGLKINFNDLKPATRLSLLNRCEQAKCNLSLNKTATIYMRELDEYGVLNETIDDKFLSNITNNLIENALELTDNVIQESKLNIVDIDCILCVGGSSNLMSLRNKMIIKFGKDKLLFPENPMWDIAKGAAEISCNPGCYKLANCIDLILSDNSKYHLLEKGQKLQTVDGKLRLGVIDNSNEAMIVLSDDIDNEKVYYTLKASFNDDGYIDNYIELLYKVDQNMVLQIEAKTKYYPQDKVMQWTYPKDLKLSYEFERMGE